MAELRLLREAIRKKHLSFGHCPKGGGDSTGIQKFWGSFVFPYFDPLLDIKWGRGGGVHPAPKVLRHFLPKFLVSIGFLSLQKSYLTVVQNGPTQKLPRGCPKKRGGGRGHFWTMSERKVLFSDGFPHTISHTLDRNRSKIHCYGSW